LKKKTKVDFGKIEVHHIKDTTSKSLIIPPKRVRYLSEISETNKAYDSWVDEQCAIASKLYKIDGVLDEIKNNEELKSTQKKYNEQLNPECKKLIDDWPSLQKIQRRFF